MKTETPSTRLNLSTALIAAAESIARVCDGAHAKDGAGFSASDANIGAGIASQDVAEFAEDPAMLEAAFWTLRKYARTQIPPDVWLKIIKMRDQCAALEAQGDFATIIAETNLRAAGRIVRAEEIARAAKELRTYSIESGVFSVRMNIQDLEFYDLKSLVKDIRGRKWNGESWQFEINQGNAQAAQLFFDAFFSPDGIPASVQSVIDAGAKVPPVARFALDVEYNSTGIAQLLISTPAPWLQGWGMIDGVEFKNALKHKFKFQWDKERQHWIGELRNEVLGYLFSYPIMWVSEERAKTEIQLISQLGRTGNAVEEPAEYPDLNSIEAVNGWRLRPYQITGADFIRDRRCSMLLDDMGSGKTAQALASLPIKARAIVIVPASLIFNWVAECALWRPDLDCIIGDLRVSTIDVPESTVWLVSNARLHDRETWNRGERSTIEPGANYRLVVDECKAFKNHDSQRTKFMRHIVNQVLRVGGRCVAMDGTPITKDPTDLWVQQDVFGLSSVCWGSFEHFVQVNGGQIVRKYVNGKPKKTVEWFGSHRPNQDLINKSMRVACLRRNKRELLPHLPAKTRHRIEISSESITVLLNEAIQIEARLKYPDDEHMRIRLIEELRECSDDKITHSGTMARLRKILACAKVNHVEREIAAYCATQESKGIPPKLVVMTASKTAAVKLAAKLSGGSNTFALFTGSQSSKEKQAAVDMFENRDLEILIVTIQAGGQGINLTAADTLFFIDWDWSFAANVQAEDRIHRSGQESSKCLYIDFVVDHWLDQIVAGVCGRKKNYHQTIEETAAAI